MSSVPIRGSFYRLSCARAISFLMTRLHTRTEYLMKGYPVYESTKSNVLSEDHPIGEKLLCLLTLLILQLRDSEINACSNLRRIP